MLQSEKNENNKICVLAIYVVFAILVNWPLVTGYSTMKWDIMDSHYPNSMFLANSLKEGILPLWNPLFNYGIPHYASLGMPVYYPTTMLAALFGYRLWMVAAEYILHIVLACFGMNLYISYTMSKETEGTSKRWIALFCGLLYGFSTLFLSNAQHIMIVISAAWIPYIFLCVRKLMETNNKKYLVYAAAFTGLSVQGGYPELWMGMLIVLVAYFLNYARGDSFLERAMRAFKYYVLYGVGTLCASAIIVIPTIVLMPYLGRLNGAQTVSVSSYQWGLFLSAIIPKWSKVYAERRIDISMCTMYMGLFTIIMIPSLARAFKNKWFNSGVIAFAISMMMGNNFFVHPIFQRFFPGFSTFRFPSVYRCLVCLFVLEMVAITCTEIFSEKNSKLRTLIGSALGVIIFLVLLCTIGQYLQGEEIVKDYEMLWHNCIISVVILSFYVCISILLYIGRIKKTRFDILLTAIIFMEVAVIYGREFPITIGEPFSLQDLLAGDRDISKDKDEANRNREYNADYRDSIRGNGFDSFVGSSVEIVEKNELSEMGYTNVKLSHIEEYKMKANRYIIQGNPVFYYAENVVSDEEISLVDWQNRWETDSREIYVENAKGEVFEESTVQEELPYSEGDVLTVIEVPVKEKFTVQYEFDKLSDSQHNRKWKMYVMDTFCEGNTLDIGFYDENDNCDYMSLCVSNLYRDNKGSFIYGIFPSHNSYSKIEVSGIEEGIVSFEYLELYNESVEENIYISEFGPNKIVLDTDTYEPSYLVTLQADYPGWQAYVDGQQWPIERVNGVFRGVYLTKGRHHIEFIFRPIDFYVGFSITACFYLFVAFVFVCDIRKGNRKYAK